MNNLSLILPYDWYAYTISSTIAMLAFLTHIRVRTYACTQLTNALRLSVVHFPPGVTRLALRGSVHRTIHAGLRHSIRTRALVPYKEKQDASTNPFSVVNVKSVQTYKCIL